MPGLGRLYQGFCAKMAISGASKASKVRENLWFKTCARTCVCAVGKGVGGWVEGAVVGAFWVVHPQKSCHMHQSMGCQWTMA